MNYLESPRRGDSNKCTKRMMYNRKTFSKISVIDALDGPVVDALDGPIKFLYNS